ncbi:uncharacterized protein LOC116433313 [Nomia melanderi]|uniref:uncharacterized protein LOC116433313 n=1 Tax=Nomia melanderi TaxID=2448451 RepID=UPI001304348F|nr:uncharacterized protein LOC116433313 [Nomia melanderi]
MYRNLMVCLLAIGCRGAILPSRDQFTTEQAEQKESVHEGLFPNSRTSNQQQPDLSHENRALSSNQHFYPSYSEHNSGYSARTGYEGYLVPVLTPQRESHWVTEIAASVLPFSAEILVYGARVGASILHLLSTILVGGAFTTIVCTFTPICSISFFGFGLSKQHVKEQVAELARAYVTPESVNAATILASRAIEKYTALQREKQEIAKRPMEERTVANAT